MDLKPKVTIAIPTYNRAAYLYEAVLSVLNQSYENIEVIISDNASPDNTEEIIKEFKDNRVSYFKQEKNIGMVNNWNFCPSQATGELFLLLSDDDILEYNAIDWFCKQFRDPNIVLAYSKVVIIDQYSNEIDKSKSAPYYESGHSFINNSLKGKRQVLPSATINLLCRPCKKTSRFSTYRNMCRFSFTFIYCKVW